jgi:hypothetical protein
MVFSRDICHILGSETKQFYDEISVKLQVSELYVDILEKTIKKFELDMSAYDLSNVYSLQTAFDVSDFVMQDYWNNEKNPMVDDTDADQKWLLTQLERLYSLEMTIQTDDWIKLQATPVNHHILDKMQKISLGTEKDLKYTYFSAHDSTIGYILQAAGLLDRECLLEAFMNSKEEDDCNTVYPPLASQLLWELVKRDEDKFYVKVNYNGTYINYCKSPNGDAENDYECTLNEFEQRVNQITYPDFDAACTGDSLVNS